MPEKKNTTSKKPAAKTATAPKKTSTAQNTARTNPPKNPKTVAPQRATNTGSARRASTTPAEMKRNANDAAEVRKRIDIETNRRWFQKYSKESRENFAAAEKELEEAKKACEQKKNKENSERLAKAQQDYKYRKAELDGQIEREEQYGKDGYNWAKQYVENRNQRQAEAAKAEKSYSSDVEEYTMAVMVHEACVQNPGVSLSKLEEICDRVEEDESLSEPYKEKVIAAMKRYDSLSDDDKAGLDYAVCSAAYEKRKAGYKKYPDLAAMAIMERIDMLNDDNYQQNIAEATKKDKEYQEDYDKNQIDEKYEEKIEKRTEKLEERGAGNLAEFFASREAYEKYKQPENIAEQNNAIEQNNAVEQKNVNTAMLLSLNAGNVR